MNQKDILGNRNLTLFLKSQPVLRAYLFGSYARNDPAQDSDIDLLVDLDECVDLFQFIAIKQKLEEILNKKVDLISSNGVLENIKPFIDKEKILIYE